MKKKNTTAVNMEYIPSFHQSHSEGTYMLSKDGPIKLIGMYGTKLLFPYCDPGFYT